MPKPTKGPRLGGSPEHQKAMLANLATSLFTHGRIHTTRTKAERLRPYAERLITKARRGDLHNRREIAQVIRDKDVVHRLMAEIGPFFADRPGGYTRITKTLPRKGDNAPMAIIELVNERTASAEASQATRVASQQGQSQQQGQEPGTPATGAAATAATIAASESETEQGAEEATDSGSTSPASGSAEDASGDASEDADSSASEGDTAPSRGDGEPSEDADSSATTGGTESDRS